ncbi:MAG: hypothetical protein ACYC4H_09395, partial [Desulfocucumaceae bacterium]
EAGERSVLSYFPSAESARRAAEELRGMGYDTVQVDRISHYGDQSSEAIKGSGDSRSQAASGLTLFSYEAGDLSVNEDLLKGNPLSSEYLDTDYGLEGGRAFLVTVVPEGSNPEKVTGLVEKHGGKI